MVDEKKTEERTEEPRMEFRERKQFKRPRRQETDESSEERVEKVFEEKEEMLAMPTKLTSAENYLKAGTHIGTKNKSGTMKKYIYKTRKDGLKIMSIQVIDERIKAAATLIASYPEGRIAFVSRKLYAQTPIKRISELLDIKTVTGRFIPGTFTNPTARHFIEPEVVIIADPDQDKQAIKEAIAINAFIISLASTNNEVNNIDFIIPSNNKGRKSLALIYWLLIREILREKGKLTDEAAFEAKLSSFEFKLKEIKDENKGEYREHEERPRRY